MKPEVLYRYSNNFLDISNINKKIFFHQSSFCYNKKLDFILDNNKKIFIGLKHKFITEQSDTITENVVMAGSIVVDLSGDAIYLDNQSGTYQFDEHALKNCLDLINKIIAINHCSICSITKNKTETYIYNKYFTESNKPNINNNVYQRYLKKYGMSRDNWILKANEFQAEKYIRLNKDLFTNPHIKHKPDKAKIHFLKFGQYEQGRILDYA
tara:strand:- start:1972 stop:2604 length:633 start_codon:yes stop_codon:yes gene_type:complete